MYASHKPNLIVWLSDNPRWQHTSVVGVCMKLVGEVHAMWTVWYGGDKNEDARVVKEAVEYVADSVMNVKSSCISCAGGNPHLTV